MQAYPKSGRIELENIFNFKTVNYATIKIYGVSATCLQDEDIQIRILKYVTNHQDIISEMNLLCKVFIPNAGQLLFFL